MGTLGRKSAILTDALRPSKNGICKSIITKLGFDSTAFCTASRPSAASAQIFQRSEWDSRSCLRMLRIACESSAINIRDGIWTRKFGITQATLLRNFNMLLDILQRVFRQENTANTG